MISLFFLLANFSIDADSMSYNAKSEKLESRDFVLTLSDGSRLHGAHASLQYGEKKELIATAYEGERILFSGSIEEGARRLPILVKAKRLTFNPNEEPLLLADGEVEIECDSSYIASGESVRFSSHDSLFTLDRGEKRVRVQTKSGERIDFDRITLDPKSGRVEGWRLEGMLNPRGDALTFSSLYGVFLSKSGEIRLNEEIKASSSRFGALTASETLTLSLENDSVKEIKTEGFTELLADKRKLLCFGEMAFQLDEGVLTLTSPPASKHEQQARYEDQFGKIFADHFRVELSHEESEPKLKRILFEGNVRLMTRHGEKRESFIEQYALADQVEFLPEEGTLKLNALPTKRVLYFDKGEGLQVSAEDLLVKRGVKGAEVKSEGLVKMKLTSSEASKLRQLIPLLKE